MDTTQLKILDILKEIKPEADFTNFDPDKSLSNYNFDSLDMMNLYFIIEERLNCQLEIEEDSESTEILSLNKICQYVK